MSVSGRTVGERSTEGAPGLQREGLEAVLEGSAGLALSEGNRVELLEDEQCLRRLAEDIRQARRSVTFQVYYAEASDVLERFAALFRERAESGVRVFVLLDAFGTKGISRRRLKRMVGPRVRLAKVRAHRLRQPLRFFHRAHCRACVIDGSVAYTGGFGLADKWDPRPGQGPTWRELGVRVEGPAALWLQGRFTELWAEARGGEVLKGDEIFPAETVQGDGPVTAGLLVSNAWQPVSAAFRFLDLLADRAERRLWIHSGYFAPSADQRLRLEGAARRGVDVRVLTCNRHTDLPWVRLAGRGRYPELLRAGVRIWEYQPRMMHAKAFLMDDVLMGVGTLNVDPIAAKLNDETVLVSLDPGLARQLGGVFLSDLADSAEVTEASLAAQSPPRLVLERAMAAMAGLL